ncbi:MAG TPA: MATE family efflux transporter, partial [Paracoccaceae bacterium]
AIVAAGREGFSLGMLYTFESGAMAVGTLLIGTFGAVALAANQVVYAVAGLFYMVPLGIAGAVTVRIAQENGAGNAAALRPIAWAALALALGWLSVAALCFGFGGRVIAALITDDAAVVALAAQMFIVIGALQLSDGVYSTMLGALRGMSDTRWPAAVATLCYWAISLPAGWILAYPLGLGPVAIWIGIGIGVAVAALALTLRFRAGTRPAGALRLG